MKLARMICAAALLLFLLTWLWLKGSTTEASSAAASLEALSDFSVAQSALHRDLLSARAGLLRNYDSLAQETTALRAAMARLQAASSGDRLLASAIATLNALVRSQEGWTEQFKSRNALLQNSLAYFAFFSGRLEDGKTDAARRATALATAMLRLTLDTSAASVSNLDAHLQEMSLSGLPPQDVAPTQALLAHAKLLRDLLPETDTTLKSLFSLRSDAQLKQIRALIVRRQQQAEQMAQRFRYLLYASSLALVGALGYLVCQLQARSRVLGKRAQMDRVLARMSTRFIDCRPEQVSALVEQGLGEVADCWGADRAYFVSVPLDAGASAAAATSHRYKWTRPGTPIPADWAARAGSFAAWQARGEGEVLHVNIPRRRSSGPAIDTGNGPPEDLRGWLGVATKRRAAKAILGLDFVRSTVSGRGSDAGQLRMVCDAIAIAVERDSQERERLRLEAHLQQARRMETVGALASGVAHNFNNIIGAILGFAESARSRPSANAKVAEDIREIQRAGGRARDLIDQLLTFGRCGSALRVPIDLDALLRECETLLRVSLPSRVRVLICEPLAPVRVAGVAAQLQQVVVNITNNAAQAMDMAGNIEINMECAEITQPMQLDAGELRAGRYGVVSISDTGRGMEAAVRERIFDPFFTTRDAGNGLGLATAREIVLEHAGGLKVTSTPGVGTRFEIWLPLTETSSPASRDDAARTTPGHGETVLVLESDHKRLLMHEEMLAALGYEPVGFTDADAAILACTQAPERFNAALLCLHVRNPECIDAGTSISARLHAAAPRLPIILATASVRDLRAPALAGNNIAAIIGQPLALAELAASLARSLQPLLHR